METEAYHSRLKSVRTTRGDESFQVLDVILLLLVLFLLNDFILLDSFAEGIIVTGVVCQLLLGQPNDVRAHTIQEVLQIVDKLFCFAHHTDTDTCTRTQTHTRAASKSNYEQNAAMLVQDCRIWSCNHSPDGTFREAPKDASKDGDQM